MEEIRGGGVVTVESTWKIKAVVGVASSGVFWRDKSIGKCSISNAVRKGDSVACLAVKYSVQVMDKRRSNNIMSDHGIFSSDRLFIPISNPDILIGATCYLEPDNHAKREVTVVYLKGCSNPNRINSLRRMTPSSEHGKRKIQDSALCNTTYQYRMVIPVPHSWSSPRRGRKRD